MLTYWETTNGIDAERVLGGLLDAGADAALVAAILAKLTLPRVAIFPARRQGAMSGIAVTIALSPVGRERRLIEAIHAVEDGALPLAVRTWGGGILRRFAEAESLVRAIPVDAVPLDDPRTVAELVAVAAALAALRVVRVFAAPLPPRSELVEPSHADLLTAILLDEAGWPEGERAEDEGRRAQWDTATEDSGLSPTSPFDLGPSSFPVTPGGAALLAALAEPGPPALRLLSIGYGLREGVLPFAVWIGELYGTTVTREDVGSLPAHAHPHPGDAR